MKIDDLRHLWKRFRETAESAGDLRDGAGMRVRLLPDFLEEVADQSMSAEEKELIADQAILIVEHLYAHLPFKRARYAIDPVQRLRILRHRADELPDLSFHAELLSIFTELKDAHTFYGLPDPYRGAVAFLPINLDAYVDEAGKRRFLVTDLLPAYEGTPLQIGSEVLFWNGVPIELAVLRSGERSPACNPAARFARGIRDLTVRSLTFSLPPDEHWVEVQYVPSPEIRRQRAAILPWCVSSNLGADVFRASRALRKSTASVNDNVVDSANARKYLWCRHQVSKELASRKDFDDLLGQGGIPNVYSWEPIPQQDEEGNHAPAPKPSESEKDRLNRESLLPAAFRFQYSDGVQQDENVDPEALRADAKPSGRFGYIRILRFDHGVPDRFELTDIFFEEFLRIVELMRKKAPDGLILDVRGNPGGNIQDAERMLQLFTCRRIQPEVFHFANSLLSQRMTETVQRALTNLSFELGSEVQAQSLSIAASRLETLDDDAGIRLESGDLLSKGKPLTEPESANAIGQRYHGPVALIVDGVSYSATDIFAAGFQDHEIGPVIGVGASTGGGGANRWTHQEDLVEVIGQVPGAPFQRLPKGAVIGFAVRRSLRMGSSTAGQPIEDTGVVCDEEYSPTLRDLTEHSFDLVRFACSILAERAAFRLSIRDARVEGEELRFRVETGNLERIEISVDERPQLSVATGRKRRRDFRIPIAELPSAAPSSVTVHGVARVDFDRRPSRNGSLEHVASVKTVLASG